MSVVPEHRSDPGSLRRTFCEENVLYVFSRPATCRDGPGPGTVMAAVESLIPIPVVIEAGLAMLEQYQAEGCPYCENAREKTTQLGLSSVIHNPRPPRANSEIPGPTSNYERSAARTGSPSSSITSAARRYTSPTTSWTISTNTTANSIRRRRRSEATEFSIVSERLPTPRQVVSLRRRRPRLRRRRTNTRY